jgi:hypothetical protein
MIFRYYDDWKSTVLECPRCGWKGTFDQGDVELYDALMDSSCPQCSWPDAPKLACVSYPTIEESEQHWSELSEEERRSVTSRKQFLARWDTTRLKASEQLPELDGRELIVVWDCVKEGAEHVTVLRHRDTEIWREPALFEGYERFREIVLILQGKYGGRLADVTPTEASELYLYGDKLSAADHVLATLKSLRDGRAMRVGDQRP